MIVLVKSHRCLWRKIRFGAIYPFIPCTTQTNFAACISLHMSKKMENSSFSKLVYQNDKVVNITQSSQSNLTIAVEGNIGSGKSTLLKHFEQSNSVEVISEPIEKWTNIKGHNALSLLYADPERWSFSFNMYALLTRVNMHTKPHTKSIKILERSLHSTRHCFIENSFLSETINKFENSILNQWYSYLIADHKADLDLIIYLRADPEVCYERLKKRSRKEEAGVPEAFLHSLHTLHDDWLLHKKFPLPAPVLVLDANSDLSTMKEIYDQTHQDIISNYQSLSLKS